MRLAALLFFFSTLPWTCNAPVTPPAPSTTTITATWDYDFGDPIVAFYVGTYDGVLCDPEAMVGAGVLSTTFSVPLGSTNTYCVQAEALDYDGSPLLSLPALYGPVQAAGASMKIWLGIPKFPTKSVVPQDSFLTRA